jgi:hypothetical protein
MEDEEIRALVRDAVARHLGRREGASEMGPHSTPAPPWRAHPSFGRFLLATGTDQGGPCLIEPGVSCNHCGYCQSYGH